MRKFGSQHNLNSEQNSPGISVLQSQLKSKCKGGTQAFHCAIIEKHTERALKAKFPVHFLQSAINLPNCEWHRFKAKTL